MKDITEDPTQISRNETVMLEIQNTLDKINNRLIIAE